MCHWRCGRVGYGAGGSAHSTNSQSHTDLSGYMALSEEEIWKLSSNLSSAKLLIFLSVIPVTQGEACKVSESIIWIIYPDL